MITDNETGRTIEQKTLLGVSHLFKVIYKQALSSIFQIFLPLFLLIFMTSRILWVLKSKRTRALSKNKMSKEQRNEAMRRQNEVTFILLVVVGVTIICQFPITIFMIFRYNMKSYCGYTLFYIEHISKLLVNVNSAVNFIIYSILSKRFRKNLHQVFCFLKEAEVRISRRVSMTGETRL